MFNPRFVPGYTLEFRFTNGSTLAEPDEEKSPDARCERMRGKILEDQEMFV